MTTGKHTTWGQVRSAARMGGGGGLAQGLGGWLC